MMVIKKNEGGKWKEKRRGKEIKKATIPLIRFNLFKITSNKEGFPKEKKNSKRELRGVGCGGVGDEGGGKDTNKRPLLAVCFFLTMNYQRWVLCKSKC